MASDYSDHSKKGVGMIKQQCHTSEGSTPNNVFQFLKLPAEIRNMIYRNVLVKRYSCYRFAQPPLTLVNKQIRRESLPVVYGNCFFAYFGSYVPVSERFRILPRTVPAIPNLAHITKLDIRFSFDAMASPIKRVMDIAIYMRGNKSECGFLGNNNLVGAPGLDWKYPGHIEYHYTRLLNSMGIAVFSNNRAVVFALCEMTSAVRTMLCFAHRCPAAAKWAWMVLQWRDLVA